MKCFLLALAPGLLGPSVATTPAEATPAPVEWTETYYVQMTFNHMGPTTAYMFDSTFTQLPNASWSSNASSITFPTGSTRLLRGAEFELVTRDSTGNVSNVSDIPSYSEMNHHFVAAALFPQYGNYTEFPVGAGSELTGFTLPDSYGYPMEGAEFGPSTWHWHNASGLDGIDKVGSSTSTDLDVFIEMKLTFSDDASLTWVFSKWYADFGICVPSASQDLQLSTATAPLSISSKTRVVLGIPHVHDHANWARLVHTDTASATTTLHTAIPANSLSYPVEHDDCGSTGQAVTWHVHGAGVGHLPVGGLAGQVYHPGGASRILQPGETLHVEGSFNNPHSQAIDNMLVYILFYELVP